MSFDHSMNRGGLSVKKCQPLILRRLPKYKKHTTKPLPMGNQIQSTVLRSLSAPSPRPGETTTPMNCHLPGTVLHIIIYYVIFYCNRPTDTRNITSPSKTRILDRQLDVDVSHPSRRGGSRSRGWGGREAPRIEKTQRCCSSSSERCIGRVQTPPSECPQLARGCLVHQRTIPSPTPRGSGRRELYRTEQNIAVHNLATSIKMFRRD